MMDGNPVPVKGRGRGRGRLPIPANVDYSPPAPGLSVESTLPSSPVGNSTNPQGRQPFGRGAGKRYNEPQNIHQEDGVPVQAGLVGLTISEVTGIPVQGSISQSPPSPRPPGVGRAKPWAIGVSDLPSLGLPIAPYLFKVDGLVKAPPLCNYQDNDYVKVLTSHPTKLNRLYIIQAKDRSLRRLIIADAITAHQRLGDKVKMPRIPVVRDIVLARPNPSKVYARCVIDEVYLSGLWGMVHVMEVDTGLNYIVSWKDILTVNDEIMAIPVMAYEVELSGVPESSNLILQSDVAHLVRATSKIKMRVKVVETKDTHCVVNLIRTDTKKDFSLEIMELKTWEWERILGLGVCRTDDEIKARGNWTSYPTEYCSPILPLDIYMRAEVVSNISLELVPPRNHLIVYIKPLTPTLLNFKNVLDGQVERYMEMVQPSLFYPATGEQVFIRPPEGRRLGGRWNRMIRLDQIVNAFYGLDTHDLVNIPPSDEAYSYRPVLPEFNRIPKCVVECALVGVDIQNPEIRNILELIFRTGRTIEFKVDKHDEEDDLDIIECRDVNVALSTMRRA